MKISHLNSIILNCMPIKTQCASDMTSQRGKGGGERACPTADAAGEETCCFTAWPAAWSGYVCARSRVL